MSIHWPDLYFPPINLYSLPRLKSDSGHTEEVSIMHSTIVDLKKNQARLAQDPERQYLSALRTIAEDGVWIENDRTGQRCKTVIGIDMTYDVGGGAFPLVTTRKLGIKTAIGELLGYLRGYTDANDFAALGAKSWYANANKTQAWLDSPHRQGPDDCGQIYGAVARRWPNHDGAKLDILTKIVSNLSAGKDDRGEILTFWNPGMFELGCLRPCMYEHIFSLEGDVLHMHSTQRSADWPIGTCANMVQCYVLLALMARITGKRPGLVYHRSINCHIYEPQLELVEEQLRRDPYETPTLTLDDRIQTLDDVLTWVTPEHFDVSGYQHHDAIQYPFTE